MENNKAKKWDPGHKYWDDVMLTAIMAASIVRECHDKMARGAGAPDREDMRRFTEEAEAIAELYQETRDIMIQEAVPHE